MFSFAYTTREKKNTVILRWRNDWKQNQQSQKVIFKNSALLQKDLWSSPVKYYAKFSKPFRAPGEKEIAPHSSTLAWKIPWTEEPGRLQSMGSQRVEHDWAASVSEGNGNPLQYSCLENPRGGEAWWAAVYGVTQSRTRLKRLSSSSS